MFDAGLLKREEKGNTITSVMDMELNYSVMGVRIANRRKRMGMKQNILAEKIEISNNYLSGIERGKEKPSLEIILKISNVLQVTPDYLLLGITHSNNVPQSIYEGLRLCSSDDLELIMGILQLLICRSGKQWSVDNYPY